MPFFTKKAMFIELQRGLAKTPMGLKHHSRKKPSRGVLSAISCSFFLYCMHSSANSEGPLNCSIVWLHLPPYAYLYIYIMYIYVYNVCIYIYIYIYSTFCQAQPLVAFLKIIFLSSMLGSHEIIIKISSS